MSRMILETDGKGIRFTTDSRRYAERERIRPIKISKIELLEFIGHLQSVSEPLLEYEVERRGMFNPFYVDRGAEAEKLIMSIRACGSAEDAYEALARRKIEYVGARKLREEFGDIFYAEDLRDLLARMGLPEEEADAYAVTVGCGAYKSRCKNGKHKRLTALSRDLHDFCTAVHQLPSRSMLLLLLPLEYARFKGEEPLPEDAENPFIKRIYMGRRNAIFKNLPPPENLCGARREKDGTLVLSSGEFAMPDKRKVTFLRWTPDGGETVCTDVCSAKREEETPQIFEEYMKRSGLVTKDLPLSESHTLRYIGAFETEDEFRMQYRED